MPSSLPLFRLTLCTAAVLFAWNASAQQAATDANPATPAQSFAVLAADAEVTVRGALATRLGNPRLAQRVGQCVGHNPISVIIPCHRVIGADGSLTGYAGGLDRKRRLLEIEEPPEAAAARLF